MEAHPSSKTDKPAAKLTTRKHHSAVASCPTTGLIVDDKCLSAKPLFMFFTNSPARTPSCVEDNVIASGRRSSGDKCDQPKDRYSSARRNMKVVDRPSDPRDRQ